MATTALLASTALAGDGAPLPGKWRIMTTSRRDGRDRERKTMKCLSAADLDVKSFAPLLGYFATRGCDTRNRRDTTPADGDGHSVTFDVVCSKAKGAPGDASGKLTIVYVPRTILMEMELGGDARITTTVWMSRHGNCD